MYLRTRCHPPVSRCSSRISSAIRFEQWVLRCSRFSSVAASLCGRRGVSGRRQRATRARQQADRDRPTWPVMFAGETEPLIARKIARSALSNASAPLLASP